MINLTNQPFENLKVRNVEHYSIPFLPLTYSKNTGVVSATPVFPNGQPGMPTVPYKPQRVLIEKNMTYLPQPNPLRDYGCAFVQTDGNWITWMYLNNGLGQGYGERLYAYNVATKKTSLIWKPLDTHTQLFDVQLNHGILYYGLDQQESTKITRCVITYNLDSHVKKTVLSTSAASNEVTLSNQKTIYDFHVSGGLIGVISAPFSQVYANPTDFPYQFNLYTLSGHLYRSVFQGTYPNQFDMASDKGTWVWSSNQGGVYYYSEKNSRDHVYHILNEASYVQISGNYIEMEPLNKPQEYLFNTKDEKYVHLPSKYKNFTITDGVIGLTTDNSMFPVNGYDLITLPTS
ncbi:hypothetical protein [Sulfoacidibacillus thermotolerans]|uniref:hypothetical protein n=1 Tax=Sulfoacidibacillus thermotolerans TaxID=1765684 RepID=UPI0011B290BA|nr:hypothetical protein [Sulfoacidibacillus thermotolerans]